MSNHHRDDVAMVDVPDQVDQAEHAPPQRQRTTLQNFTQGLGQFIGIGVLQNSVDIHRGARERKMRMGAPPSVGVEQDEAFERFDPEDYEAMMEHKNLDDVPMCTPPEGLVIRLGRGVMWYFRFIKFLWGFNGLLSLVALISIIPHLSEVADRDESDRPDFPQVFYLSSYAPETREAWQTSSAFAVILIFLVGPIYRSYVKYKIAGRMRGDEDYVEDPFEGMYEVDTDECVDKIPYEVPPRRRDQYLGRFMSFSLFVLVLVLQGVINYYLQSALGTEASGTAATAIAATIVGINIAWTLLCQVLTKLEKHKYWSHYKRSDTLKVFIFKICNVLVLYFVKSLEYGQNDDTQGCVAEIMAEQFGILMIADIVIVNIFEILLPVVGIWALKGYAQRSDKGNDEFKPEFDLAEEYVEVVYRQFIVALGVFVLPIMPILALFGNLIEYWLDKYRLLRIAKKPSPTKNTNRDLLLFCFFLSGLCIIFVPPNGAIWILSGDVSSLDDRCAVYQ